MLQSVVATQACAATCMRLSPTYNAAGTAGAPGLAQRQKRASARRSLSTKFAVTAASGDSIGDGSGGSNNNSSNSPPRQQQYEVGASVYDASHHGASSCRGYGTIVGWADLADDGTQRWKVEWVKEGTRTKPIKEAYLELSVIQSRHRKPPSGLDQPILVVLGTHKGKTGVTKRKSGTGFSCQLEGVHGLQHCNPDSLHATGPPPEEKELQQFQAKLLAGNLPVAELQGWLTAYQEDPPCDLLRSKPDSGVWCDVLTGQRSIDSLSVDELLRLHYVASRYCSSAAHGGACNGQSDAAAGAAGAKAALSAAAIRAGLQKAAQGSWMIKLVCFQSPATKCGCPFTLEIKHRGGGLVDVWQTEAHQFHDPTSHADLSQLRMSSQAEAYASWLLECGTPPVRVALLVNNKLIKDGAAAPAGCPGGSNNGSSSSSGGGVSQEAGSSNGSSSTMGLAMFSNARLFITKEQVRALLKRIQREAGFGLTTDERAVAAQMAVLAKEGCLGFYQPYKEGGKEGKGGQPLVIILQTRFQKRMLLAFGRRLVFLDATGGTNKYGYMLYAVVVVDESGRGVPVGFMICSADPAEVVEKFLRELQRGANEEAKVLGVEAFAYGHIMIDKSKTEMAAVHLLVLSGDALGWLLCYFHMLQDWERFLTSAESGVLGREAQHNVMMALARLAHCREESAFKAQLHLFYGAYTASPAVCGRMKSAWEPLAERWAWYGRVELLDLRSNTNNPVERCFGLVKYTDLARKTQSTIQQLVETLLSKTVARNMYNRGLMLAGRSTSEQQRAEQRAERQVEALVAGGKVQAASPEGSTTVRCDSGNKQVCVGDLSCSCSYSGEYVCIHIAAAARQVGYTPALRKRVAAYLVGSGLIQVEEATGISCCPALGDPLGKSMTFRPADGFCTCHGYALHNTCCHLLAAAELPAFQDVHIPVMVHAAAEDEGTRIDISCQRTFQQAPFEPMGDDMGAGELHALLATQSATAVAVQHGQSNANPAVAAIRGDLATIQRIALGLPAEDQQELQQAIQDLCSKAEGMAEAAHMQPTETGVGKQERRRKGRPEGQRVVTALHRGRKNKRSRAALIQQQQEQLQPEDCSDPLPKAAKKGKPTHKMRGPTAPGNVDGTVLRHGAPHHRRRKQHR